METFTAITTECQAMSACLSSGCGLTFQPLSCNVLRQSSHGPLRRQLLPLYWAQRGVGGGGGGMVYIHHYPTGASFILSSVRRQVAKCVCACVTNSMCACVCVRVCVCVCVCVLKRACMWGVCSACVGVSVWAYYSMVWVVCVLLRMYVHQIKVGCGLN